MGLEGKVALVTGASRGIGEATALEMAARGAKHIILAARSMDDLEQVRQRVEAAGGSASVLQLDLSKPESVAAFVRAVTDRWDALDIVMINAAFAPSIASVPDIDPEEFSTTLMVNVQATQALIAGFHALLEKSGSGRLIGVTSGAGLRPYPNFSSYGASKTAFDMLINTYAAENAENPKIRAALMAPGPTRTGMRARGFPDEDPMTLKTVEFVAQNLVDLIEQDFPNGHYLDVHKIFLESGST